MSDVPSLLPPEEVAFARLLVEQGLVGYDAANDCLREIHRLAEAGIRPLPRLAELLQRRGLLTAAQTESTLRRHPIDGALPAIESPPEVRDAPAEMRFGRFTCTLRLGGGGQAEVFKAWDSRLGCWIALKFPRDGEGLDAVLDEARKARQVVHPNVAPIYDVGTTDVGRPYIAMQFVEGKTLDRHREDDIRTLAHLMRDAAHGIESAHSKGVVHRDLKPANFMAQRVEGGLHVYVMDFGMARAPRVEGKSLPGVCGTPSYMAPEQARGEEVDARADVWGLGATFYSLFAGVAPFPHSVDPYETVRRVANDPVTPLLARRPDLDPDLAAIVMRCLEKERDRRYRSALELAADLDRWLRGEPVTARRLGPLGRLRKLALRRRRDPARAALVVAARARRPDAPDLRREPRSRPGAPAERQRLADGRIRREGPCRVRPGLARSAGFARAAGPLGPHAARAHAARRSARAAGDRAGQGPGERARAVRAARPGRAALPAPHDGARADRAGRRVAPAGAGGAARAGRSSFGAIVARARTG